MRVFVYWNLHRKCWSVRSEATRKVIAHVDRIQLADAKFRVSQAGNARVRREGKKNVHAGVHGIWIGGPEEIEPIGPCRAVRYNPYEMTTFQDMAGNPVTQASEVRLINRSVIAW